jgi:ribosomal protein L31
MYREDEKLVCKCIATCKKCGKLYSTVEGKHTCVVEKTVREVSVELCKKCGNYFIDADRHVCAQKKNTEEAQKHCEKNM